MKPLRLSTRLLSALGFLSIQLTDEIAVGWLVASWLAWAFSLLSDLVPQEWIQRRRPGGSRFETWAVAGMVVMLFVDFLVIRSSIFIALTHFLLLFQIVKLIGEKSRKDYFQIFLFSFFQILAACTLSVDAWHAAVLLALIPLATAALFWNQIEQEYEIAQQATSNVQKSYRRMAALICAITLPLNLFLTGAVFVIFPRLTLNASLPGFSGHRSGYTDQMNLAQTGTMSQDSSVVLWLSFPKTDERGRWDGYLRGDILDQFDGRQWSASKNGKTRVVTPDSNGVYTLRSFPTGSSFLHQTITLADTSAATLFVIGKPVRVVAPLPSLQESEAGSLRWSASWNRPLRYEVTSIPYSDADANSTATALPRMPLERIRALADQMAGTGPPLKQAQRIEQYLQQHYRYSTNFGDRIAENPVEYFLFERREGTCGHFASAMALLLRVKGIPSRLVAGYLKGEWNEPAHSVVIRQRDAHAWVEVFVAGRGWVSFDPSPRQSAGGSSRVTLVRRLAQYWNYLDLQWNRFVIQYDLYSQIKAFENVRGASGRWGAAWAARWAKLQWKHPRRAPSKLSESDADTPTHFPWKKTVSIILLSLISLILVQRRQSQYHSTIKFYLTFLKNMDRAGCPKYPWETGQEFARRLAQNRPDQAEASRRITQDYYLRRFKRGVS